MFSFLPVLAVTWEGSELVLLGARPFRREPALPGQRLSLVLDAYTFPSLLAFYLNLWVKVRDLKKKKGKKKSFLVHEGINTLNYLFSSTKKVNVQSYLVVEKNRNRETSLEIKVILTPGLRRNIALRRAGF